MTVELKARTCRMKWMVREQNRYSSHGGHIHVGIRTSVRRGAKA